MAITTRDRVKAILGITTTDHDDRIDALIPQVEDDYVQIRGKPFDVGTLLTVESTGVGADEKVTITIGNYAEVGAAAQGVEFNVVIRAGDTAGVIARRIVNQVLPSGYYTLTAPMVDSTSTSAGVYFRERFERFTEDFSVLDMTVDPAVGLTSEVEVMQTIYPEGAEYTAAKMIHFAMNAGAGVTSERLGDYSVTYDASGAYPRSITSSIKKYVTTR